jgi:ribosomal-protein-alanine N-acetyltransferase
VTGRHDAARYLIETARLRLRRVSDGDLDALYRIWTEPAVRRFFWDGEVISKERAEAAVREGSEDFAKHGFGLWAAEEGGCLIGFCGLRHLDYASGVEILYGFAPSHWDRGFATEVAAAMLRYGFEEVGLDRILGITDKENTASRRVLEKLGMTFEDQVLREGREEVCYSISREDFRLDSPTPDTRARR